MDSKKPASEAKEHECEYYLDGESIVYGCECGDIEIGGKIYYPEDKVNPLKEEITRLKAELERERELRKEAWNNAIDACISIVRSTGSNGMSYKKFLQSELENQKIDYGKDR